MKTCRICGETSDNFRAQRRTCRTCENKSGREYHKKNKERINRNKVSKNNQRYIEKRTYIVDYLKSHPCVDCGETNPIVLQFDHVRGEKVAKISSIINYGMKVLKEEIDKCDIRCANCHAKATAARAGWWWAEEFLENLDLPLDTD